MNVEDVRNFALSLPEVVEDMPFDDNTLVFRIENKVFLLFGLVPFDYVLVKCEPEMALELRRMYDAVVPGYHMNKKHWNGIYHGKDVSDSQILEWIKASYRLVVEGLPIYRQRILERNNPVFFSSLR